MPPGAEQAEDVVGLEDGVAADAFRPGGAEEILRFPFPLLAELLDEPVAGYHFSFQLLAAVARCFIGADVYLAEPLDPSHVVRTLNDLEGQGRPALAEVHLERDEQHFVEVLAVAGEDVGRSDGIYPRNRSHNAHCCLHLDFGRLGAEKLVADDLRLADGLWAVWSGDDPAQAVGAFVAVWPFPRPCAWDFCDPVSVYYLWVDGRRVVTLAQPAEEPFAQSAAVRGIRHIDPVKQTPSVAGIDNDRLWPAVLCELGDDRVSHQPRGFVFRFGGVIVRVPFSLDRIHVDIKPAPVLATSFHRCQRRYTSGRFTRGKPTRNVGVWPLLAWWSCQAWERG